MENLIFEETALAAQLLNEFHSLSQRATVSEAASVFFDKQYLTIAEFLAPIGDPLKVRRTEPSGSGSIENFITASLKRKTNPKKFRDALGKTLLAQETTEAPKPLTIRTFLDKLI